MRSLTRLSRTASTRTASAREPAGNRPGHTLTSAFKDHFSGHADRYASARPTYPDALFAWLADASPGLTFAWDCATGNGQAARSLAAHFEQVVATDASGEQIDAALAHPDVDFRVAPAERSGLADDAADLITVAQALHWFDIDAFFAEAMRVLKPGGVLAYWCYGVCRVSDDCDRIIAEFYQSIDEFWPPERELVESGYRSIEAPLPRLEAPDFGMQAEWSAAQMLDYLGTWSACQRAHRAAAANPLIGFDERLRAAWGDRARTVRWPLGLTACRLE